MQRVTVIGSPPYIHRSMIPPTSDLHLAPNRLFDRPLLCLCFCAKKARDELPPTDQGSKNGEGDGPDSPRVCVRPSGGSVGSLLPK